MTKREQLIEKINMLKQYLSLLTNDKWNDEEIGLPKNISRIAEVDRILDLILEYREKLKTLNKRN